MELRRPRFLERLRQRPEAPAPEAGPELVSQLERLVGTTPGPRICVLHNDRTRPALDAIDGWRADAQIVPVDARKSGRELHVELTALGPFDAIVDLMPRGAVARFNDLLLHVRAGGGYLIRRSPHDRLDHQIVSLVGSLDDADDADDADETPAARRVSRRQAAATSTTEASVGAKVVGVRQTAAALAVVRDAEAAKVFELDPRRGEVLDRIPGQSWPVRCRLRTSSPPSANPAPAAYDAPDLFLRRYGPSVCMPRQVAVSGNWLLPESFTTVEHHRQRNTAVHNLGTDFAVPPAVGPDLPMLPGIYFHLDNVLTWHFGHAVSEQISHLWGWQRAKRLMPDLKALMFTKTGATEPWQADLLAAGGVATDDLVVRSEPVAVEGLVGCTPMYSRPAFVHPGLLDTYDEISSALSRGAPQDVDWPARIFLGRRSRKRACVNADVVVEEFTSAGFTVLYPEDYPLAQQVEYVRRASVIAGFAGSGMFHIALTGAAKHVILVSSESYPAHNEYMMAALLGHRLDVVLCRPEVARGQQWTRESFHSDFTYDPAREGTFLRSVLGELES